MRLLIRNREERPLRDVPRWVWVALAVAFSAQTGVASRLAAPAARPEALPSPPAVEQLRLVALGEEVALAKATMLWLQAFDYRAGTQIPYRNLDYDRVTAWLDRIIALDPHGQYPLLSAARLYAEVPDPIKQRAMLALIHRHFLDDPARRWPWLAHAAVLAKHRLSDLPLALEFARALRAKAVGPDVPAWVRQMEPFLLEDMNELEAARILIGGLLASGQVQDPREIELLEKRLKALESRVEAERK